MVTHGTQFGLGLRDGGGVLTTSLSASLVTIFEHNGNTDPTAEGWTQDGPNAAGVSAGGVTNDGGFDSWFVDDNSSIGGAFLNYRANPTDELILAGDLNGWVLRARVRAVDLPDAPGTGSVFMGYESGTRRYSIMIGAEEDGDPIAQLWDGTGDIPNNVLNGQTFTLQGGGDGYHLYELVYDPILDSADLFINGVERISDYAGHTFQAGTKRVVWGSGSSIDTGEGRYNLVQWQVNVVPEPTSTALMATAAVLCCLCGRRRTDRIAR